MQSRRGALALLGAILAGSMNNNFGNAVEYKPTRSYEPDDVKPRPSSHSYGGNKQNNSHYPKFGGAQEIARRKARFDNKTA